MAGVPDKGLVQVGRFPAGVDNVAPLTNPPRDDNGNIVAARELENVDIDNAGRARLRRGQVLVESVPAHSLYGTPNYLFAWVDTELRAYRQAGTTIEVDTTLLTDLPDRFFTYASDDYDVFCSNGLGQWRIAANLSVHPFWPDTPIPPSVSASSAGGLAAGQYEVALTVIDADGRESGASDPVVITLDAGQGIEVLLPPAPEDAARWRIYRTTPDGGEGANILYLAQELPIAASTAVLAATITEKTLQTAWLQPLPPTSLLRYGHGRLVCAAFEGLVWSEPYALGLMAEGNHIGLYGGCRLLEPMGEGGDAPGWFVSDAKRTYWFNGADPKGWRQRIVHPHAAVPGTSVVVSGTVMGLDTAEPVAVWLSANGTWLMGLPGGQVSPIREGALALPVNAERGAAAFFQNNGVQQIVAALLGGEANPVNASVGDSASATIRRHGIEID